jgi:hypothetical protein
MKKTEAVPGRSVHRGTAVRWADWAVAQPAAGAGQQDLLHDAIARLAYSYWEARGRQGGSAEEDWLRAETEIRNALAARALENPVPQSERMTGIGKARQSR